MPKFLVEASYTTEGLQGLIKDKASGREAAIRQMLSANGGKLDSIYFTLGDRDVILICDLPDTSTAASIVLAASSSGMVRTRTTPLLTVEEADAVITKGVTYRAPGA